MADQRVLVDASAWTDFFNRPHSKEKLILDLLIDSGWAAMTLGGRRCSPNQVFPRWCSTIRKSWKTTSAANDG